MTTQWFKRGGEKRESTLWLRAVLVENGFSSRSNLSVKYPSRIWVNPILEGICPLLYCDIPNKTKGQPNQVRIKTMGGDGYIVGLRSRAKTASGRIRAGLAEARKRTVAV